MRTACLRWLAFASSLFVAPPAVLDAEPTDLFSDAPRFIRIGTWNLRHVNVEGSADEFLPGVTLEEDFAILIDTFAKAIDDLVLHLVVIVEHQPRSGKPNRVHQIRQLLLHETDASLQPCPIPPTKMPSLKKFVCTTPDPARLR